MAGAVKIRSGTRLRLAYDVPIGQEPNFNFVCTFTKSIDESAFLISVPMKEGKPIIMDENMKLLIRYTQGQEELILAGYPDAEVREGIHRYWKIRRVSEQRQFFKRADERVKAPLRVQYFQQTWPVNEDGTFSMEDGMTIDISAGGVALYLNRVFDVGDICDMVLPRVGTTEDGRSITVTGEICWKREAPKGSLYRHIAGLQFRFNENQDKEEVKKYVLNVKKRYKA